MAGGVDECRDRHRGASGSPCEGHYGWLGVLDDHVGDVVARVVPGDCGRNEAHTAARGHQREHLDDAGAPSSDASGQPVVALLRQPSGGPCTVGPFDWIGDEALLAQVRECQPGNMELKVIELRPFAALQMLFRGEPER